MRGLASTHRLLLNRGVVLASLCAWLLFASPQWSFALSLEEAKSQGLVGEQPSGYLGVVTGGSEVSGLVQSVNTQRKQKYADIAKKNGTTVSAVEALAGRKAIENTASGHFIKTPSGEWKKK